MDCPRKQKLGQSNNGLSSGYKISQDGLGKVLLIHISGCCNPSSPSPAYVQSVKVRSSKQLLKGKRDDKYLHKYNR